MISPGDLAPDFELPDQDGERVRLSDLRGRTVVLYFYPRADTPGCTTQACSIRDREADYAAAGVKVIGVSPDPVGKVKRFHDKRELNFTLLADEDHAVCDLYGVWVQKSMYGRKYMGAQRATFVIGRDGRVGHVIPKASPKTHDDEVLAVLAYYAVNDRAVQHARELIGGRQCARNPTGLTRSPMPPPRTPTSSATPGTSTRPGTSASPRGRRTA